MNRILDVVEGMADHTKSQVKKTFDFFKDWGKIFGKKGLITAGLVGLLAFLNKSGLLKKLLDFLGKGIGDIGQSISDAFSQAVKIPNGIKRTVRIQMSNLAQKSSKVS